MLTYRCQDYQRFASISHGDNLPPSSNIDDDFGHLQARSDTFLTENDPYIWDYEHYVKLWQNMANLVHICSY